MDRKRQSRNRSARRRMVTQAAVTVVFMAVSFGLAAQAYAFLCSRGTDLDGNRTGPSFAWFDTNISYSFNPNTTGNIDPDSARSAVNDSFAVWQNATLRAGQTNCAFISPVTVPYTTVLNFTVGADSPQDFTGFNYLDMNSNLNMVLFRDNTWPHLSDEDGIIALTTTTFNHVTGEIFDADIEFNTAEITFTTDDDPTSGDTDLMNTASHEVGHFIGFSHSTDSNATMYAVASQGETIKRELACDDAAALLFRYNTSTIGYCDDDNSNNCGDCQPSDGMEFVPNIKTQAVNTGIKHIVCSNAGTTAWPALLVLLWGWRQRPRRSGRMKS